MTAKIEQPPIRAGSRSRAAVALALFICSSLVFLVSPVHQVSDSNYTLLLSHQLLRWGDARLDEAFTLPLDPDQYPTIISGDYPYQVEAIGGHVYYRFPPGSSILSVPFVALAGLLGVSPLNAAGRYDVKAERALQYVEAAILMGALTAVTFLLGLYALPTGWSLVVASAVAFGSPVWSTASRGLWSHTWAILLLGLATFLLGLGARPGGRTRPWLLATLLAWTFIVRPLGAIPLVTVGAYLALTQRRAFWQYALVVVAWLAVFVAWSQATYGLPLPAYYLRPYADSGFDLSGVPLGLAGLLVSPGRGLLIYIPSVLFVAYLIARYGTGQSAGGLVWLALINCGLQAVLLAGWPQWWGGHAYGPRLLTELVPWLALLAVLGVSGWLARRGRRPPTGELVIGLVLLAASLALNGRGALDTRTQLWNIEPDNVDQHPERLWDWRSPPFLVSR